MNSLLGKEKLIVSDKPGTTRDAIDTDFEIGGQSFTPLVREPGLYSVVAYDPDGGYRQEWKELRAVKV